VHAERATIRKWKHLAHKFSKKHPEAKLSAKRVQLMEEFMKSQTA